MILLEGREGQEKRGDYNEGSIRDVGLWRRGKVRAGSSRTAEQVDECL